MFKYAIDGFASFSVAPLRWLAGTGFVISFVAFVYIIVTLVKTLIFGIDVPGYVTTLCAVLFMGGIIELSIGILGEYISRIYMESKHRPIYLVKDTNINDNSSNEATTDEKSEKEADKAESNSKIKITKDNPKNEEKSKKIQKITEAVEKAVANEKDEPEKVEYDLSYFE